MFGKIGYTEGRELYGSKLDLNITYNHLKKHILDKYENHDIFIHSWDFKDIDYLKNIFKPTDIYCEKQKNFGINIDKLSQDQKNDENNLGSYFRAISQTYSMINSIDLSIKYEKSKDFQYDYIIVLRLDSIFLKDICLEKLNKDKIYLQPKVCFNNKSQRLKWNNESKCYIHSGFIIILNSKLLKNTKYKDIYNYQYLNSNNESNAYRNIEKISTFSFLNPILINNKICDDLEDKLVNIIRRHYYLSETYYQNNSLKKINTNSQNDLNSRWKIYSEFYSK